MLLLGLSARFAWRLGGGAIALCVTALMAVAPTQIHMSQHALIDGVFAFWATLSLWLLWENLQRPNRWPWLAAYGFALAAMVLTKENAMFAYLAILALLAANHWLRFGQLTMNLCFATLLGPLLGAVVLITLCGGLGTTIEIYRLLVSKASTLEYAIVTGDGPWYRYLVDLMVVSPVILVLAIGGIFRLQTTERAGIFLASLCGGEFSGHGEHSLRNEPSLYQHVGLPVALSGSALPLGNHPAKKRARGLDESLRVRSLHDRAAPIQHLLCPE